MLDSLEQLLQGYAANVGVSYDNFLLGGIGFCVLLIVLIKVFKKNKPKVGKGGQASLHSGESVIKPQVSKPNSEKVA